MIVNKDGSVSLTRDEWNETVKPALETYVKGSEIVLAEKEIKSVENTDKTNFKSDEARLPVKEVSA